MNKSFEAISFKDDKLTLINQTLLPHNEEYITTDDVERIAIAIERLEVRGAPAIGVAAAYALALSHKDLNVKSIDRFNDAYARLKSTRPTAVNLFWALDKMKKVFNDHQDEENIYDGLLKAAREIHEDDVAKCKRMASNGAAIFTKPRLKILTHCNTGRLATGGDGTALNVIISAFKKGCVEHVYADETRPLFQGSRLTAFELSKAGIPFSVNTDSSAAVLMTKGNVDLVIVGADRIALNGDSANKIGTYNLALLCSLHEIPFYIAAPTSTIDKKCITGDDIEIEMRQGDEIFKYKSEMISSETYNYFNPAFDVTPAKYISGIITELDLHKPPFDFNHV